MILPVSPHAQLPDGSWRIEWGVEGVFAVGADHRGGFRHCLLGPARWLSVLVPITRVWRTSRAGGWLLLWLRPHPAGLLLALEALALGRRSI